MLEILPIEILPMAFFAFFAGLVDATVGGGGLIQVPAFFNFFPSTTPATLFGTNKLVSISGTAFAARSYISRVKLPWGLILPAALSAFIMAFLGAATVPLIPTNVIKPVVLITLILVAIYTFYKKDFGQLHKPSFIGTYEKFLAIIVGGAIGFYDGLFGPGAGSFLIFVFIRIFAFDFLHASAAAKFVNLATNAAALSFFLPNHYVIYKLAFVMAIFNILGAICGAKLALHKGAQFIRIVFLILVCIFIFKLGFEFLFSS